MINNRQTSAIIYHFLSRDIFIIFQQLYVMKEKKTMSEERLFFVFCCIRSPTLSSCFLIFQTSDAANLQLSFLQINERKKYSKIHLCIACFFFASCVFFILYTIDRRIFCLHVYIYIYIFMYLKNFSHDTESLESLYRLSIISEDNTKPLSIFFCGGLCFSSIDE